MSKALLFVCSVMTLFSSSTCVADTGLASRKLAWAHYVPWYIPADVSKYPASHYEFPVHEKGTDPHRYEIERAQAMGLNGFFVDVIVQYNLSQSGSRYRPGYYWVVGDLLKAAEGRDFYVAPCLDVKTDVDTQVDDIVWMLEQYGNHPNYPRVDGKYVLGTYTFREWTADEWRRMREGCASRGYPLFLVANAKYSCGVLLPSQLNAYKDVMDVVYSFAYVGLETWATDVENRSTANWCAANDRLYMPCVNPGYSGSWLKETNPAYQSHLGVDKMMREVNSMRETGGQWLHFTSWNDFCETALEPSPLTPGYAQFVRAVSDDFKGLTPSADKADVLFAYLREELPGTQIRIEAMRLPSTEEGEVTVSGVLEDANGNVVRTLPSRTLSAVWERVEWLVPSADLAFTPCLRPRLRMSAPSGVRERGFPEIFFHTPWIENPVTVKTTFSSRAEVVGSLSVSWASGAYTAKADFSNGVPVRRAILFWNGRPAGQFQTGGARYVSYPDLTLREAPVLDSTGGTYELSLAGRAPRASDVFWIRYELADGTCCESRPVWPKPSDRPTWEMPILETSVTLETLPGTQGLPRTEPNVAYDEHLTPEEDRPVNGTSTVTAEVAVAAMREEKWPLDGSDVCTYGSRPATVDAKTGVTKLPLRVWPMDSAEVELDIRPEREATSNETMIARVGTGAAFTLTRLKGGRLAAEWSGRACGGVWDIQVANRLAITGQTAVATGDWHHVRLVNDLSELKLVIDGRVDARCPFAAYRAHGPTTVYVGGEADGSRRFGGRIANLSIGPKSGHVASAESGETARDCSSSDTATARIDVRSACFGDGRFLPVPDDPFEAREFSRDVLELEPFYDSLRPLLIIIR